MSQPLVSIVIAAYNARAWLGEAIDSALAQTYGNCEVLVVDDGSTDGTGEWLAERYGSDQVRYLWKENGGLASARNRALAHARGEYIQFLDADDIILPEKVATHVDALLRLPEYGVAYCHSLCFHDGSPNETFDWWGRDLYRSGDVFASMIDTGYILTHATLTRRKWIDAVGPFDESLPSCVDWDFWLRVARCGAQFYLSEGPPMALYRLRPDTMSSRRVAHALAGLRVLEKVADSSSTREERERLGVRAARGRWRFSLGRALVEAGDPLSGWRQMARSLLDDRRNLRYKLVYMLGAPLLGHQRTLGVLALGRRLIGGARGAAAAGEA